ncbi:hypothetical protein [Ralstonia phage P-PSG-11-1]|uniref:Uncharacterized protein n=1 Tax=Ralstonia phage P-PSG-11 TaxID=2652430 RepID=A0A5P8D3U8_9CAUD|nr:hypothetical protein [Ralstonia phage P-PSG-11]QFP93723.1 hypothetical protein [Ralstonia phage P-PSG-11-1]
MPRSKQAGSEAPEANSAESPAVTVEDSVSEQQPKRALEPVKVTELPGGVKIEDF